MTELGTGKLHHLRQLLELAASSRTRGLVLDLGGRLFKGPIRGKTPWQLVVACRGTVIRNGTLQLPDTTLLLVKAKGCLFEDVNVIGMGIEGA